MVVGERKITHLLVPVALMSFTDHQGTNEVNDGIR